MSKNTKRNIKHTANLFGGYTYYENGKKFGESRPNPFAEDTQTMTPKERKSAAVSRRFSAGAIITTMPKVTKSAAVNRPCLAAVPLSTMQTVSAAERLKKISSHWPPNPLRLLPAAKAHRPLPIPAPPPHPHMPGVNLPMKATNTALTPKITRPRKNTRRRLMR